MTRDFGDSEDILMVTEEKSHADVDQLIGRLPDVNVQSF